MESGRLGTEWSTRYARRVSPWLKLEASNIALTAATRSRFTRPAVHIQVSTIAATARTSAGRTENSLAAKRHDDMDVRDMNDQLSLSGSEPDWLKSDDLRVKRLRRVANWLIYASVILGIALLEQLYALMVPSLLFYSILAGWILYLVAAIAVATGRDKAYPAALVLSIVTLIVSLPQPEHYSLAEAGPTLASLTFIAGSVLQIGVIILVTSSMFLERRQSGLRTVSIQR